jgi:hypothetical protein
MKKINQLFIISAFTILSISNAQGQPEELKKFLDAYKTSEFDESKKIIKDYSFNVDATYTMSEYSSVNGLFFDTDIPGVKGYKAIINCKLENKALQFIDKRMMVVMYFDKERKIWAVFGIREVADATNEYNIAKNDVEANKFYTKKEFVYRGLAYWCMMAGKLQDAKKYIELGIEEAKSTNNSSFTTNFDLILKAIL